MLFGIASLLRRVSFSGIDYKMMILNASLFKRVNRMPLVISVPIINIKKNQSHSLDHIKTGREFFFSIICIEYSFYIV